MRELPLYNGAVRQGAQQQFARVQAPHVENMGGMVDSALQQLGTEADKVIKLHDFGVQQDVEAKQRENDIEAEKEFMRRSALPWGDEDSFYLADGRVNDDSVKRYIAEQQQKNVLVEGNYWGGEAKLEHAARVSDVNGRLAQKVTLGLAAQENANRRRAFEANYELAVERGDMPGALRALADAERAGQLLPAEVAKRKLQLHKKQLKDIGAAGGSVVVNGQEYSGASAGLAVARAKAGRAVVGVTKDEEQSEVGVASAAAPAELQRDEVVAETEGSEGLTLGADGSVPVIGQDAAAAESVTLDEERMSRVSAGEVNEFAAGYANELVEGRPESGREKSEEERSWTLLPQRDVRDFFDSMNDSVRVKQVLRGDGGLDLFCESYAPDVVQRVVARANAVGELTAADAGEMVTVIAIDAVHANAGASVESLLKMFEGAGVYEALGDGDEAVGKVRAAALVNECKERMEKGTNKLGMDAIVRMVAARVDEVYRASGRDVGRLNPRLEKKQKWVDREDRRWHELKHLYLGLRKEFNPALQDGLSHEKLMKEFEGNAQEFYDWYAGRDGIGTQRNAEYKAALKDWYTGQVSMRLADAYVGGGRFKDGSGGFAADVAVAREVLKEVPPEVLNADVLAKQREVQQKEDEERAENMRKVAAEQYAKLKGLKEERSTKKAVEEKAKKKAEEKAAREEEKRLKAEEKKAQQLEQRKLAVKRARPRRAVWEWDGVQAADGEAPACSLPKTEWNALVEELGYDGATNVYVQLGSRKVLVTGYHEGDTVRLNTPAAMLLQDKKKDAALRTYGDLGYSYSFK